MRGSKLIILSWFCIFISLVQKGSLLETNKASLWNEWFWVSHSLCRLFTHTQKKKRFPQTIEFFLPKPSQYRHCFVEFVSVKILLPLLSLSWWVEVAYIRNIHNNTTEECCQDNLTSTWKIMVDKTHINILKIWKLKIHLKTRSVSNSNKIILIIFYFFLQWISFSSTMKLNEIFLKSIFIPNRLASTSNVDKIYLLRTIDAKLVKNHSDMTTACFKKFGVKNAFWSSFEECALRTLRLVLPCW